MPDRMKTYPITEAIREELWAAAKEEGRTEMPDVLTQLIDVLGEYEHGTAAVEDVHPGMTLQMYAAVVLDLGLSIVNWVE